MFAGLPGTGIGGLFYVILVLLMGFRESWRAIASDRRDLLKFAMFHTGIVIAIIAALWLEAVGLAKGLLLLELMAPWVTEHLWHSSKAYDAIVPAFALAPFVILTSVWAIVRLASMIVGPLAKGA